VLVVTTKEVPLPKHAQAMTLTQNIPIIKNVVEGKTNEVMYTEGMIYLKYIIAERIVPIPAERIVYI
jgi:hypothetical protein